MVGCVPLFSVQILVKLGHVMIIRIAELGGRLGSRRMSGIEQNWEWERAFIGVLCIYVIFTVFHTSSNSHIKTTHLVVLYGTFPGHFSVQCYVSLQFIVVNLNNLSWFNSIYHSIQNNSLWFNSISYSIQNEK